MSKPKQQYHRIILPTLGRRTSKRPRCDNTCSLDKMKLFFHVRSCSQPANSAQRKGSYNATTIEDFSFQWEQLLVWEHLLGWSGKGTVWQANWTLVMPLPSVPPNFKLHGVATTRCDKKTYLQNSTCSKLKRGWVGAVDQKWHATVQNV